MIKNCLLLKDITLCFSYCLKGHAKVCYSPAILLLIIDADCFSQIQNFEKYTERLREEIDFFMIYWEV